MLLACRPWLAEAQQGYDPRLGSWLITSLVKQTNQQGWGGFLEVQTRQQHLVSLFFYNEVKGGISRRLNDQITASLAGGRYSTFDPDDLDLAIGEWRIWEQLVMSQFLDRLKFEHRYRVEQRWLNGVYRNRFRYRLNLVVPLNHPTVTNKTWFVSVYNEIFLNNRQPHFERNRVFAGMGHQFSKRWTLQSGAVYQYNVQPAAWNSKLNAVLLLTYTLPGSPRERIPTLID